jgi:hypothetical protein
MIILTSLCIGAIAIGLITSVSGYGWFKNGKFQGKGSIMNLSLLALWDCLVLLLFLK